MKVEHCHSSDSHVKFVTSNYGLTTCPAEEWRIVKDIDKGFERDHRRIPNYKELKKAEFAERAKLGDPEIIAVILYTGPMVNVSAQFYFWVLFLF